LYSLDARCNHATYRNLLVLAIIQYIRFRTARKFSPKDKKNKHILLKMFDINLLKHNNIEKHFIRDSKETDCNKMFTKVRMHALHLDLYGKVQNNYSRVTKQLTRTNIKIWKLRLSFHKYHHDSYISGSLNSKSKKSDKVNKKKLVGERQWNMGDIKVTKGRIMSSTNGVDFKERVKREYIFRKAKYRLISHRRTLAILTVGVIT
jgi:hypothetical protein